MYSSFIGGGDRDRVLDVDVHGSGLVALSGWTWSNDLTTTATARDSSLDGLSDGFVQVIAPLPIGPSQLLYASFLGGSSHDKAAAIEVHANLSLSLAGETRSLDFPTTPGAFRRQVAGGGATPPPDCWVAHLDVTLPAADQLVYSTLLGGSDSDVVVSLALDNHNRRLLASRSMSGDFPVGPTAYQTALRGPQDVAVTLFDMLPFGVTEYGSGTDGCDGPRTISVGSQPALGNTGFAVTAERAPPRAQGLFVLGGAARQTPLQLVNVELWVETAIPRAIVIPVASDPYGAVRLPLAIPAEPLLAGLSIFGQFVWIDGSSQAPPCAATRPVRHPGSADADPTVIAIFCEKRPGAAEEKPRSRDCMSTAQPHSA